MVKISARNLDFACSAIIYLTKLLGNKDTVISPELAQFYLDGAEEALQELTDVCRKRPHEEVFVDLEDTAEGR
ncbi:MAG TPA: hypothetical protein VFF14_01385 [Candidatus Deferrimicrobium sp.]|nr:hypothetical protein [Candidatus Deferrimicrobium sp.]